MTGLIMIIIAFLVGMALGGLIVGMDKDSDHKEGEDDNEDNIV